MVDSALTAESTSRMVRTKGWNLHYHEAGVGAPLLMLHGSGPGATAWGNFQTNIPHLAKTNRVLALDQPGWGPSDPVEAGEGGHIQAILEFLDALEIERVSFAGNSLGAANAIEFTMRYPDRVNRLITMGAPDMSQSHVFLPSGPPHGLLEVYKGYVHRDHAAFRRLVDVMTFGNEFLADDLIQARLEEALKVPHHLDAFLERAFKGPDPGRIEWTARKLGAIQAPTLLIHGRDDRVVPYESTLRLLAAIPNSRAHIFNHCGHWSQLERPAEFNAVVAEFLSLDDVSAPVGTDFFTQIGNALK